MAKIHILAYDHDPLLRARAYDMLKQRFEAGEDLGPRIHHIRSLVSSLEVHVRELLRLMTGLGDETALRLPRGADGPPPPPPSKPSRQESSAQEV